MQRKMYKLLVLTICLISHARTADKRSLLEEPSAATRSQIMYAIEQNFDATGPGATKREYAYKTYNTLEDALVNYLNDPDTVLPELEKDIAVRQLMKAENYLPRIVPVPKIRDYTGYNKPVISFPQRQNEHKYIDFRSPLTSNVVISNYKEDPIRLQKYQAVKGQPINLAHYTKDPDVSETHGDFNPNPQYSFSYGVHDKHTGDSKSAHETRDGGVVKGYYTFLDADGAQRTVHYTADDEGGFRATVQRSTHTQ